MKKLLLLILSATLLALHSFAQPGSIDPTFNPSDIGYGTGDGFYNDDPLYGDVLTIAVQPDDKVIVGGSFNSYNNSYRGKICRTNSDGTLDTTFTPPTTFQGQEIKALTIQPDGKIVAGGYFSISNSNIVNLVRFNADGSFDQAFNSGGTGPDAGNYVDALALQSDGKILVGGSFNAYNGVSSKKIARINTNGSLDATFNIGSGFYYNGNYQINYIEIQPDEKILAGGTFSSYNGTTQYGLVRLNTDGSFDSTFMHSIVNLSMPFALQPDGKILARSSGDLIRLNSDGSTDNSFLVGISISDFSEMILQSDGKIIIVNTNNYIRRLNPDGSLDGSFTTTSENNINALALQSDGKLIVGGNFNFWDDIWCQEIVRLNDTGARDFTFNPFSGINGVSDPVVNAIVQQPDGKILLGGDFSLYNGVSRKNIVRINTNGSIDNTFDPGTGFDAYVNCIALQTDGKIVVGGGFTEFNGTSASLIARLNTDGSLDGSFTAPGLSGTPVKAIAIQSDGKIIAVGDFDGYYSSVTRKNIVRLNIDGSYDTNFNMGTGFNIDGVEAVVIQPDGKIVCGGQFTSYNGTSSKRIVRINTDGTIDANFVLGTGFSSSSVYDLKLQPDGKIIVTGGFSSYNGTSISKIARINSTGSIDPSFVPGSSVTFTPNSLAITSDDKIVLGGYSFNSVEMIRLNSNGSVDQSFDVGEGSDAGIYTIAIQPDDDILIGGYFTSFNGIGRNRIARLQGGSGNCSAGFTLSPDPNTQHNWFAVNTCSGTPTITYDWNWGDGSSNSSGAYPSHTYSTAGYYNICVSITDGSGCTDTYCDNSTYIYKTAEMVTVNVVNQLPTGISETENGAVKIYPNPATNTLTIETANTTGIYQLQDITGKVLLSGNVTATKFSLDISALCKGIYLLSLIDGEQQVNRKVVKE